MEMELGKLFIGGISWDTNEERLREYFQAFGEVVEAVIMKDRTTGRARGFGFVVFADSIVAERVVMEKHMIDGRIVSFILAWHWGLLVIKTSWISNYLSFSQTDEVELHMLILRVRIPQLQWVYETIHLALCFYGCHNGLIS